jgi:hypothetical protein
MAAVPVYFAVAAVFARLRITSGRVLLMISLYLADSAMVSGEWFFALVYGIVAILQWQGADPWGHLIDRQRREIMLASVEPRGQYVFYAVITAVFCATDYYQVLFSDVELHHKAHLLFATLLIVGAVVVYVFEQRRVQRAAG